MSNDLEQTVIARVTWLSPFVGTMSTIWLRVWSFTIFDLYIYVQGGLINIVVWKLDSR